MSSCYPLSMSAHQRDVHETSDGLKCGWQLILCYFIFFIFFFPSVMCTFKYISELCAHTYAHILNTYTSAKLSNTLLSRWVFLCYTQSDTQSKSYTCQCFVFLSLSLSLCRSCNVWKATTEWKKMKKQTILREKDAAFVHSLVTTWTKSKVHMQQRQQQFSIDYYVVRFSYDFLLDFYVT